MAETDSRYDQLKRVVESLATVDVNMKRLPVVIGKLRRQAERALVFKQAPRNENMDAARAAAREVSRQKADEFKAAVLPEIAKARKNGAKSVREIAEALNKAGIKTSRGGEWSAGTVFRFLGDD